MLQPNMQKFAMFVIGCWTFITVLSGCLAEYDSGGFAVVYQPPADEDQEVETVERPADWDSEYERETVESSFVYDEPFKQELHYDLYPMLSNISCGQNVRDILYVQYPSYDLLYVATDLALCVMHSNYPGIFVPVVNLGVPAGGFVAVKRTASGLVVAASPTTVFIESGDGWDSYNLPEPDVAITTMLVEGDAKVYIGTTSGLFELDLSQENPTIERNADFEQIEVRALELFDGELYIATPQGVYKRTESGFETFVEGVDAYALKTRFVPELELWVGTLFGVRVFPKDGAPYTLDEMQPTGDEAHVYDALPKIDVVRIYFNEDGTVWLGFASGGVARWEEGVGWHYYQSRRWLPSDIVQAIAGKTRDRMFFGTPAGIGVVYTEPMTLEEKASRITDIIKLRHDRHGLVAGCKLNTPGDLSSFEMHDHDNDGLWTSIWVASQCFRYAATKDIDALGNARKSINAMLFLEEVTGKPGFVARSILHKELERPEKPDYGEWHESKDGVWWWKGDTSSDEIDGHLFAYTLYYRLCADKYDQEKIRDTVGRILDHIIENGYQLVDVDGETTQWGHWEPEIVNGGVGRLGEQGLRSLEILTYLTVGYYMFKDVDEERAQKYLWHKYYLITEHHYLENILRQKDITVGRFENNSDDELAFLMYYTFASVEDDPYIMQYLDESLRTAFGYEQIEDSSLFNFVYGSVFGLSEEVLDGALRHLYNYPLDLREWSVKNSDRTDLALVEYETPFNPHLRFSDWFIKKNGQVVPVDERRIMKWNGSPFKMDGGCGGCEEDDGAAFLLPYWMGRYYGFIRVPEENGSTQE